MLSALAHLSVCAASLRAHFFRVQAARCLLALLALLLFSSAAAHATNPTVPQGGTASFAKTATGNFPTNGSWDIYLSGTLKGSANGANGWSVTYNSSTSQFTVTAPGNSTYAPVATGYVVRLVYGMGSAVFATFDVVAGTLTLSSVAVSPTAVIGAGGASVTGTVTLSLAAPSNTTVSLASDTPSAATIPASVTVNTGQTTATFAVTTLAVTTSTTVTLSALYNGITKTATLTVAPKPTVTTVTFPPGGSTTSPIGGTSFTGKVTLSVAAASAISVTLQSDTPSVTSVPASVSVAAGANNATFTVTTTAVANPTTTVITASYNGSSAQGTVIVQPPQLLVPGGLTLSPSTTAGGNDINATVHLTGIAPTGGFPIYLTSSLANTVVLKSSGTPVPTSGTSAVITVPAGQSSYTQSLTTSTVNYTTQLTLSATQGTDPNTWIQQNAALTLLASHLWVSDILLPHTLRVNWDMAATGPSYVLKRDGTVVATVANSVKTFNDNFGAGTFGNGGTQYIYTLYDTDSSNTPTTLLCTEKVTPYTIAAQAGNTQAVDSRLDLRESSNVFLNHNFGATIYRGGLFAGYASDPAKVGRSFARFNLNTVSTALNGGSGSYRNGSVNAYFTGAMGTATIGCQPVNNNFWDPVNNVSTTTPWDSTLVWSTAPQVNPANAVTTATVTGTTPGWVAWSMTPQVYNALQGSGILPVAWTSSNEASSGWAYFAKPEYDTNYPPMLACLLESPTLIQVVLGASPGAVPGQANAWYGSYNGTCTIIVNGVGPNDTAHVMLSSNRTGGSGAGSTFLTCNGVDIPPTGLDFPVTGLQRTFTLAASANFMGLPIGTNCGVTLTATCGGVSASVTLILWYPAQ